MEQRTPADDVVDGLSAAARLLRAAAARVTDESSLEGLSPEAIKWTCSALVRHFGQTLHAVLGEDDEATAKTLRQFADIIETVDTVELAAEVLVWSAEETIREELTP